MLLLLATLAQADLLPPGPPTEAPATDLPAPTDPGAAPGWVTPASIAGGVLCLGAAVLLFRQRQPADSS